MTIVELWSWHARQAFVADKRIDRHTVDAELGSKLAIEYVNQARRQCKFHRECCIAIEHAVTIPTLARSATITDAEVAEAISDPVASPLRDRT